MAYKITFIVTGIVQGVGFRPFCARLAMELGLGGSVRNTSDGVEITISGPKVDVNDYMTRLQTENPDASAITDLVIMDESEIPDNAYSSRFSIEKSRRMTRQRVLIPPDIATCSDCLEELRNPADRRFGYPFINCTNCGPRYTIIKDLPYDRPYTTMKNFKMCSNCLEEYTRGTDRRFHAQPNACFVCGPRIWFEDCKGKFRKGSDKTIEESVTRLKQGEIIAIKGIGGFHLACDPENPAALANLRSRKRRIRKPFALMVRDIESARKICIVTPKIEGILTSSKRPIVICYKRKKSGICEGIAPGQEDIGIMLPYTPLHHLIMDNFTALVMTSANISDSPIISDNDDAKEKLGSIADGFLLHNRDIHMPIDDSVIAHSGRFSIIMRRARGFVPVPLGLPINSPVILAAGSEMKSTFAFAQEKTIFPGQYLGDLKQIPTIKYYRRALRHFMKLYNLEPEYLVHDMHPQYLSTQIAREETKVEKNNVLAVQHHHAHFSSCLLENRHWEKAIGLILDGTGYGPDGTIWGGEFFVGDIKDYTRVGHFLPSNLPGGEKAVLQPWRYALSLLSHTFGNNGCLETAISIWPDFKDKIEQIGATVNSSPVTTSAGRLFDGVSALLNICPQASYDGEPAITLEAISRGSGKAPFDYFYEKDNWILDWRPAIEWIIKNRLTMKEDEISAAFHYGLSRVLVNIAMEISSQTGVSHVALSGGVWQNRRLLNVTCSLLERKGLKPLVHKTLSTNDECVSVGQVVIGAYKWIE